MKPQDYLNIAKIYADSSSGCNKVAVGSVIIKQGQIVALGANRVFGNECKHHGCHRMRLYGEDSKNHRNPEDCLSIHSEIDAIAQAKTDLEGSTIFVTRYPCEGCTKAIIAAGISEVYYGGTTRVTPLTEKMLRGAGISLNFVEGLSEDHTYR